MGILKYQNKRNIIRCIYDITENDLNTNVNIINWDEHNKEELKNKCKLYIQTFYGKKNINFEKIYKFTNVEENTIIIQFHGFIKNISSLFKGCSKLTEVYFNEFESAKIEDIEYLFKDCESLKKIDFSNFDTSNVKKFEGIVNNCPINKRDVIGYENVEYFFNKCVHDKGIQTEIIYNQENIIMNTNNSESNNGNNSERKILTITKKSTMVNNEDIQIFDDTLKSSTKSNKKNKKIKTKSFNNNGSIIQKN